MKFYLKLLILVLLLAGGFMGLPDYRAADGQASQFPPQLLTFSAAKEQQVRALALNLNIELSPEISAFFKSAEHGDYAAVTNTVERLAPEYVASYKNPPGSLPAWIPFWQPMTEVESAYDAFATGGKKYPLAFGEGIIQSIPAGSIYFGGSDAGRMLVTALCESHVLAKPFYTLTQNALSDGRYMDYLRATYGKRIYLPTTNDVQVALDNYKADAQRRLGHDEEFPHGPRQIKRGEDVRMVDGQVQVNGAVSVMAIHARLVKVILEHNPKLKFYMEESYPMDLIYPYLSPHGLIFKLDHEPLAALTSQMLDADRAFWSRECETMLGGWLKPDTSVSNVCAFADAVYRQKDWSHFTGDKAYVTNDFATQAFSKLRVSIAGLYQWRMANMTEGDDKARLQAEADYAFRQAFALCPSSPEALFRYVDFLLSQGRSDDALLIARVSQKLVPDSEQFNGMVPQLQYYREQQGTARAP